jgi:hypothetical protein
MTALDRTRLGQAERVAVAADVAVNCGSSASGATSITLAGLFTRYLLSGGGVTRGGVITTSGGGSSRRSSLA